MQPKFKFTLPGIEMNKAEKEIWNLFQEGKKEIITKMLEKWNLLKQEKNTQLSTITLDILNQSK